jgi:hypothetical protein
VLFQERPDVRRARVSHRDLLVRTHDRRLRAAYFGTVTQLPAWTCLPRPPRLEMSR